MSITSLMGTRRRRQSSKADKVKYTPTPFYPPEILSIILSFVNQHTLIHSARYVNKQWLILSQPFIRTHAIWKDFDNGEHNRLSLIPNLHHVTDLCVQFGRGWYYNFTLELWEDLLGKIDTLNTSNQLKISKLAIVYVTHLIPMVYPILSKLPALTDFSLTEVSSPEIHLGSILQLCPSLLRLYINNESCTGDHKIMDTISANDSNTTTADEATSCIISESPIRTLIIRGMRVEQSVIEGILQRCPDLRTLKLEQILNLEDQATLFDQPKFFEFVAKTCTKLRQFHFSFYNHPMSAEIAASMIQTFFASNKQFMSSSSSLSLEQSSLVRRLYPQQQQQQQPATWEIAPFETISVLDRDIDSPTAHIFLAPILNPSFNNIITTLEIMHSIEQSNYDCVVHALHNVLCSTPSLLHLLAAAVPYFSEYLDLSDKVPLEEPIWNCTSGCPASEPGFKEKRIWACRGLRTLQLKIIPKLKRDVASVENSRMMFGYISKVCPDLRELAIFRWELNLKWEGGLCLLSRLSSLRRLTIRSWTKTRLKKRDLDWMNTSNSSSRNKFVPKLLHQWMMLTRRSLFKNPGRTTAIENRNDIKVGMDSDLVIRQSKERRSSSRELTWEDMMDVGTIAELHACQEELRRSKDTNESCWPMLEFLGLRHSYGKNQGPGRYLPVLMSKILPGVEFSCSYSK
ncbi:hypothetical protein BGZ76_010927 [Entomortierella beljakovae]|nr:hypothetical protein BGZ76_010927 [Entomortierella beljakovae]